MKFTKNKVKLLSKLDRRQNALSSSGNTNRILKKKINAKKKVSFQKDVLLKEIIHNDKLVTPVSKEKIVKSIQNKNPLPDIKSHVIKMKPVEKQKKRQKMQINDTKLLLSLIKKRN